MGLPVVLHGSEGAQLVLSAERATAGRLRAMGRAVLALTRWRAETLAIRTYDGDLARIEIPAHADPAWLIALADPVQDLAAPLKGPFQSVRSGSAQLARGALRLLKRARLLPAAVLAPAREAYGALTHISLADLDFGGQLRHAGAASLPLDASPDGHLRLFRSADGGEEHAVVQIGAPDREAPVLVRLHSACFTGDVLASRKCDCGAQLSTALSAMGQEGTGLLLYLDQEGRGIGLANKLRAYALQDQGYDTVEANHRLGFEDDERDFRIGAEMLRALGIRRIRLMTNNPGKVARMEASGIEVADRVPLIVGATPENARYLATKARKSGHFL